MSDPFKDHLVDSINELKVIVSDTKDSVISLDKKVDLHIQKTEFELSRIHQQDEVQNRLLDEHIAGVKTLQKLYEEHDGKDQERFDRLEAPRTWLRQTWSGLVHVMAFLGAVEALVKILEYLNR